LLIIDRNDASRFNISNEYRNLFDYLKTDGDSSFLLFDFLENEARKVGGCIQTFFAFVLNDNAHKIAALDELNSVME